MSRLSRAVPVLILLFSVVLQCVVFLKGRFIDWPEMLSYPYFVNRGYAFYSGIIDQHTPLLPYVLALVFRVAPYEAIVLRFFALACHLATSCTLFFWLKKRAGPGTAAVSVFIFSTMSIAFGPPGLWYEDFAMPVLVGAVFCMHRFTFERGPRGMAVAAGLLFGIGIVIKQTAAYPFVASILFFVLHRGRRIAAADLAILVIFGCLPYWVFALGYALHGSAGEYLYWTLIYPVLEYKGDADLFPATKDLAWSTLAMFGPALGYLLTTRDKPLWRMSEKIFWIVILATSAIGAFPRWGYFHLVPMFPFAALIGSLVVCDLIFNFGSDFRSSEHRFRVVMVLVILAGWLGAMGAGIRPNLRHLWYEGDSGNFYMTVPGTAKVYDWLKPRVEPGDRIFNLGGNWDNLYPRLQAESGAGIYLNPFPWWLAAHDTDRRIVEGLKRFEPRYIVMAQRRQYNNTETLRYIDEHYEFKLWPRGTSGVLERRASSE